MKVEVVYASDAKRQPTASDCCASRAARQMESDTSHMSQCSYVVGFARDSAVKGGSEADGPSKPAVDMLTRYGAAPWLSGSLASIGGHTVLVWISSRCWLTKRGCGLELLFERSMVDCDSWTRKVSSGLKTVSTTVPRASHRNARVVKSSYQ